ncbi:RCC1 domain-containing protein 1 [Ciona intestinalis]
MPSLYGFGYNGFGQISSDVKRDCVFSPLCITSQTKCKVLTSSHTWSSSIYSYDEKLLRRGLTNNPSKELTKENIPSKCTRSILNFDDHGYGILKDNGEFVLQLEPERNEIFTKGNVEAVAKDSNGFYLVADDVLLHCNNILEKPIIMRPMFSSHKVRNVSCGNCHSLLSTHNGNVFSWGIGSHGQLGHGDMETLKQPHLIDALDGVCIKRVVAGGWHSVALADTDDLYVWGWNQSGQTGFQAPVGICTNSTEALKMENSTEDSNAIGVVLNPTLLELEMCANSNSFVSIIDVSCGVRHTAAVTSCGTLITWGWSRYGQLCHPCCKPDTDIPTDSAHGEAHLPQTVMWFKTQGLYVSGAVCGPWNTFVTTSDYG